MIKRSVLSILLLAGAGQVMAINISGNLSTTQMGPSLNPWVVTSTVRVLAAATLYVEAGTIIQLCKGQNFEVSGKLVVNGTDSASVFFTSTLTGKIPGQWGGMVFSGYGRGNINNAVIEYGGAYGESMLHFGDDASVTMYGCVVRRSSERAIYISGRSKLCFQDGSIVDNDCTSTGAAAIYLENITQKSLYISNSDIKNSGTNGNKVGIYVLGGIDKENVRIESNYFANNQSGILLKGAARVSGNTFYDHVNNAVEGSFVCIAYSEFGNPDHNDYSHMQTGYKGIVASCHHLSVTHS